MNSLGDGDCVSGTGPAFQFVVALVEGLVYHFFANVLHPFPPVSGEFTQCEALQAPSLPLWLHKCPGILRLSSGRNVSPPSQKPDRSSGWLLVVFEPRQGKPALKDLVKFWSDVCATPALSGYPGLLPYWVLETHRVDLPAHLCKPHVLHGLGYIVLYTMGIQNKC